MYFDDRILLTDGYAWAYYRIPSVSYESTPIWACRKIQLLTVLTIQKRSFCRLRSSHMTTGQPGSDPRAGAGQLLAKSGGMGVPAGEWRGRYATAANKRNVAHSNDAGPGFRLSLVSVGL